MDVHTPSPAEIPRLRRVLGLWDLILYGIVAVTPSAPVTVFGLALIMSKGHAVDTILAAMVAMVLTGFSYGRMAALYPAAGSAYTYVGRGLNPHLGFLAGWAMLLDYVVIPLFCVIYGSLAIQRLFPQVPFLVWSACMAGAMTYLNLRGIRSTARANQVLISSMMCVLLAFIFLAIRFVTRQQGWSGLFTLQPFFNPRTFRLGSVATATSFAALTYVGFDSVTTLAEDVHNPRRNVLLAVVWVVVITALLSGGQVYLAHQVWPDYTIYPNAETAFMDVYRRVGGAPMFHAMGVVLIVACFASALGGQVAATRILYGMGRDGVLPPVLARLTSRRRTPAVAIIAIGLLAFVPSGIVNFEKTAEILNSGALAAYMAVNLAGFWQFYVRGHEL